MSEQTDQLLLYSLDKPDVEAEREAKQQREVEVGRARQRLRCLMDLQKHAGHLIVQEALQDAVYDAFVGMDKSADPTSLAKCSGMHYGATMALKYVELEIKRLEALLRGAAS